MSSKKNLLPLLSKRQLDNYFTEMSRKDVHSVFREMRINDEMRERQVGIRGHRMMGNRGKFLVCSFCDQRHYLSDGPVSSTCECLSSELKGPLSYLRRLRGTSGPRSNWFQENGFKVTFKIERNLISSYRRIVLIAEHCWTGHKIEYVSPEALRFGSGPSSNRFFDHVRRCNVGPLARGVYNLRQSCEVFAGQWKRDIVCFLKG